MPFEWDEKKRLSTIENRGFDFLDAIELFDGRPALHGRSFFDKEQRFVTVALLRGKCCTVVWTWRGENRRVISFRRARDAEERAYQAIHG